ncbi:hypothetical protein L9F63_000274 [Diploptera punctata]|uniref:CPL domain-containing protein n=1 Tax=Diploptera punctata TaxID=6984 RepID=A0AAD8AMU8_DIPPU|nr:hypothetical protein L9F63_000274 [Diploptera punctata]
MLKHGNANSKRVIVNSLRGKVIKLVSHSVAAPMFEIIYSKWATSSERNLLQQEFFGDMYKHEKESDVVRLEDALNMPAMKGAVLSAVKANIVRILDKKLAKSSLLHSVLLDFLKFCSKEDREEVCQQIQECLLDFIGTKNGAQIVVRCICQATNKSKKSIMKSLKGHVMEIAKSEYGHLVLLSLFDTVDDTVLLKKLLMPELLCDLVGLANNEYGKKVLLYLVAHRDHLYFHPSDIAILKEGVALSNSKKDMNVRITEIKEVVLNPLLEAIANDPKGWMSSSSIEMVTLAVLKSGNGNEAKKAFEAIAEYVCDLNVKIVENGKEINIMEHPGTHMMLKKLILHDKEKAAEERVTFSSVLVSKLSTEILSSWIKCNRGCFVFSFSFGNFIEFSDARCFGETSQFDKSNQDRNFSWSKNPFQ